MLKLCTSCLRTLPLPLFCCCCSSFGFARKNHRHLPKLFSSSRPAKLLRFHSPGFWVNRRPNSKLIHPDRRNLCFLTPGRHRWWIIKELKLSLHLTAYSFISSQHGFSSLPLLLLCVWHNKRKSVSLLGATVCNFRSL